MRRKAQTWEMGALFSNTQIPALLVRWDGGACASLHTWALLHAENLLSLSMLPGTRLECAVFLQAEREQAFPTALG